MNLPEHVRSPHLAHPTKVLGLGGEWAKHVTLPTIESMMPRPGSVAVEEIRGDTLVSYSPATAFDAAPPVELTAAQLAQLINYGNEVYYQGEHTTNDRFFLVQYEGQSRYPLGIILDNDVILASLEDTGDVLDIKGEEVGRYASLPKQEGDSRDLHRLFILLPIPIEYFERLSDAARSSSEEMDTR